MLRVGKQKGRHASVLANAKVSKMISVIDSKVGSLKEIFRKGDPLDERRQAATKIAATIRGYLARAHLTAYMHGIREWKWLRARPLVHVLDILLSNQSSLDAGIQLQIMNRQTHTLRVVFSKWCIVCKQNAPMRKSILIAAEERIAEKRKYLVRAVFTGFVAVTIGHLSRRNANKQRRLLIESIRADLSRKLLERGLIGVVPEDDITRTLYRRVLEQFLAKKRMLSIKSIFDELKKILVKSRRNYQAGVKQRFKVLAGACFYAWSDYTYLQAIGLDRRRWIAPRQYEVFSNPTVATQFALK